MSGPGAYDRSVRFSGIGPGGQGRISAATLAIAGVGAVGTVAAEIAVRAGFGRVVLVDRDVVDESNLQRQFLFDAADAGAGRPKAAAAAEKLAAINPRVALEPVCADLDSDNVALHLGSADVVLDGCDNFEARFLISDFGKKTLRPTVHAACVAAEGLVAVALPRPDWPCLRCYLGALPPPGSGPTCETDGVVPSLPAMAAAIAMGEVLRLAVGGAPSRGVLTFSVWEGDLAPVRAFASARPSVMCDVCAGRRFPALESAPAGAAARLCGRGTIQIKGLAVESLDGIARRLAAVSGDVRVAEGLVRARVEDCRVTVFEDGRCLVQGTEDPARARSLLARYVGV